MKRCKTWVEMELASSLRRVVPFEVSYWRSQPWRKLSLSFVSKRRPLEFMAGGGFKVTMNSWSMAPWTQRLVILMDTGSVLMDIGIGLGPVVLVVPALTLAIFRKEKIVWKC